MKTFKFEIVATTKDGVNVVFDGEVAIDTEVYVIAEDGSKIPAPDGDLIFEDGTIIGVIGGRVSSITPPSEDSSEEDMSSEETKIEEPKINEFDSQLTEIKTEFQTQISEIKTEFALIKELITNLSNNLESEKAVIEEKFKSVVLPVEKNEEKVNTKTPSLSTLFSAIKKNSKK